jgi:hypothetical protein
MSLVRQNRSTITRWQENSKNDVNSIMCYLYFSYVYGERHLWSEPDEVWQVCRTRDVMNCIKCHLGCTNIVQFFSGKAKRSSSTAVHALIYTCVVKHMKIKSMSFHILRFGSLYVFSINFWTTEQNWVKYWGVIDTNLARHIQLWRAGWPGDFTPNNNVPFVNWCSLVPSIRSITSNICRFASECASVDVQYWSIVDCKLFHWKDSVTFYANNNHIWTLSHNTQANAWAYIMTNRLTFYSRTRYLHGSGK